ncbi:MAG: transcription antitermination factor NusB [Acidimicrobiia bacterium]|jgi:N utilization substance protein B
MNRPEAREEALKRLYEADQRGSEPFTGDLGRRAAEVVEGVWAEREALDAAIGGVSRRWRVERMPPVDRNVIRIALWELRHHTRTPVPVVISEAVRMAKAYSTERSGGFVNGVLAKLADEQVAAGE